MDNRYFSIGAVLKNGWAKFKEHPYTWIGAFLLTFMIGMVPSFFNIIGNMSEPIQNAEPVSNLAPYLFPLLIIVFSLIQIGLSLGIVSMALRAVDGLPVNIFHLFSRFYYVFHYLIAGMVFGLITMVGFILLVFPAAIWGAKFSLFPYFILDKGAGPFQALKLSAEATKGFKWDVFAFILVSIVLTLAGFAALLLGIFVSAPILHIGWALIYRKLTAVDATQPASPVVEQVQSSTGY